MSLIGDAIGFSGSGRAAKSVSDANIAAEQGVLGATTSATGAVGSAVGKATNDIGTAGANVNQSALNANQGLQDTRGQINTNLSGYLASGQQGNDLAQAHAAANPQFDFDPAKYLNSDAYKFQLAQGQDAITNRASAMGLSSSGNALKDLTSFGQGLGATYYNQAFNQAQSQFQTNQNATLANIQTLLGAGQFGTGQYDAANTSLSGLQSANTTGAASTNANLAEYVGGLGVQGAEAQGQFSMNGAQSAGNFAVGAGQAHAAGIMNQDAALSSGVSDLASLFMPGAGIIPAGGGK